MGPGAFGLASVERSCWRGHGPCFTLGQGVRVAGELEDVLLASVAFFHRHYKMPDKSNLREEESVSIHCLGKLSIIVVGKAL